MSLVEGTTTMQEFLMNLEPCDIVVMWAKNKSVVVISGCDTGAKASEACLTMAQAFRLSDNCPNGDGCDED